MSMHNFSQSSPFLNKWRLNKSKLTKPFVHCFVNIDRDLTFSHNSSKGTLIACRPFHAWGGEIRTSQQYHVIIVPFSMWTLQKWTTGLHTSNHSFTVMIIHYMHNCHGCSKKKGVNHNTNPSATTNQIIEEQFLFHSSPYQAVIHMIHLMNLLQQHSRSKSAFCFQAENIVPMIQWHNLPVVVSIFKPLQLFFLTYCGG